MKTNELEDIYNELISTYINLKAEVIVAEIQENSKTNIGDIVINNKSTFNRSFRRDIIDVSDINLINDSRLTLNLSRNGIYDYLPKGLFHSVDLNKKSNSFSSNRKLLKTQEQDARLFFAPIDNEFFFQRLLIERNERELLDNFYTLDNEFLIDFWNLSEQCPKEYAIKLIKLLPFCYKIAGDFELTRLCLENLLDEKVKLTAKIDKSIGNEENNKSRDYKEPQLGMNMILDSSTNEVNRPVLDVVIGPIEENKINNFIKKDGIIKFINKFYDYFVPLEYEVRTKFDVLKRNGFLLNNDESPIMGISTQI